MFYLFNVNYSIFIYFCVFISIKLLTVAHFQKTQTGLRWLRRAHPASNTALRARRFVQNKKEQHKLLLSAKKIQDF